MKDHAVDPVFWSAPGGPAARLSVSPRLASWDAAGSTSQVALNHYLDAAMDALGEQLTARASSLALRLDVRLPEQIDLLTERDLDNYLLPLARRVDQQHPGRLTSVWATKSHGEYTQVRVEPTSRPTVPEGPPVLPVGTLRVQTSASTESTAYKQQIRTQVLDQHGHRPLPDGPVHLEVAFVVGNTRNWLNLWKPTIDALDPILGHDPGGKPWHPLDGRITTLGLHRQVDPDAGHDITLAILAEPAAHRHGRADRDFAPVVTQVRAAGGTTEHALAEIRRQGGHMIDAVKALRSADGTDLGVLKQMLDASPAWADHRDSNRRLRQTVIEHLETLEREDEARA